VEEKKLTSEFNIYVGLALAGFFTGIGNVTAQYVWSEWLKPRIEQLRKIKEEKDESQKI
jgi:hypothetical protein